MSTVLTWGITGAQVLLGLALACSTLRILWGPGLRTAFWDSTASI